MCIKMYKVVLLFWLYINYGSSQSSDEVFFSRHFQSQIEHLQWRTKRNAYYQPSIADLCTLPPYPEHGSYTTSNLTNLTPGQTTTTFELTVSCDDGYGLVGGEGTPEGAEVMCFYGEWNQAMPKCERVRYCRLNPNPSVRYECQEPGTSWFKPCPLLVSPGTLVNPVCNSPFYYSHNTLLYMRCARGSWNYIAQCTAECGRVVPAAKQLVIGGREAERGELPWHVAIYDKTDHFKLICGGSIVSNHLVISAAHCFWSDASKILPASNFAVATGKQYSSYDSKEDVDAQISDVNDIKIPKRYLGVANNLQGDIAVVILTTPFEYKTYVRPVCLNFDKNFDRRQLQVGKLGKIAGFGLTAANGGPSPVLKVVDLPYIDFDTCVNTVSASFREYLTLDKFCAGYTNGTALCQGDSGGGLAFVERDLGVERYYLRGVVSASPRDDNACSQFTVTTFTRITAVDDFIKEAVATSMVAACTSFQYQCANGACVDLGAECNGTEECTDGSDESHLLCHATTTINMRHKPGCVLPPYPENGTYIVADYPDALPGQSVTSYNLTVTCHHGYVAVKPEYSAETVVCVNGTANSEVPKCARDFRFCELEKDPSVRYACVEPVAFNDLLPCKNELFSPGSKVQPICNKDYYFRDPYGPRAMECVAGDWQFVDKCKADCGRIYSRQEPTVPSLYYETPSKEVMAGDVPWNVLIYSGEYNLLCSGSIVSNNIVVTAASCLRDDVSTHHLQVVANKFFQELHSVRDQDTQSSKVLNIKFPYTSNEENIAVLILETPFVFNEFVRPICMDTAFIQTHLEEGQKGKVTGWLPTYVQGSTNRLKVLEMTYLTPEHCRTGVKEQNLSGLICTGYNEAWPSLTNNRGSGLAYVHNESGTERYFLRGVLSRPMTGCADDCPANYSGVAYFVNMTEHEQFVKQFL